MVRTHCPNCQHVTISGFCPVPSCYVNGAIEGSKDNRYVDWTRQYDDNFLRSLRVVETTEKSRYNGAYQRRVEYVRA